MKEEAVMMKARLGKEIVVKVRNEIGVLDQMCRLMADKGINLLAVLGTTDGDDAILRFVTADNLRVSDMLRARNFNPHETDCLLVERAHKPGMLRRISEELAAEGVNIEHLYATAGESQPGCLIALSTSNNEHALVVLNR